MCQERKHFCSLIAICRNGRDLRKIVNSFALSSTKFHLVTGATVASVGDDTHRFDLKPQNARAPTLTNDIF